MTHPTSSKIEAERWEVEHSCSTRGDHRRAISNPRPPAPTAKKLELIVDRRSRPVSRWWATRRRVQQALLNLVSNAIKLTDRDMLVAAEQSSPTESGGSGDRHGIGIPRDAARR